MILEKGASRGDARRGDRGGDAFRGARVFASEVVEEIVAKINDDIITKSELENEEQAVLAEIYKQFSGADLDKQVARTRKELLRRLIDNKVLYHRAFRPDRISRRRSTPRPVTAARSKRMRAVV